VFTPSFASCVSLREAFGESTDDTEAEGVDGTESVLMEPGVEWWPNYPEDYCDFCNCSDFDPGSYGWHYYDDMMVMESALAADSAGSAAKASGDGNAGAAQSADEFSGTNNQIEDVDESDIVKTDGQFVYVLPRNEKILVIAKAYPFDEVTVVSTTNLTKYNMDPREMLLDGDSLVIMGTARVKNEALNIWGMSLVSVQLWDISVRSSPQLIKTHEVEGGFNTARLIDGFAYVVMQTWPYSTYYGPAVMSKMAVSSGPGMLQRQVMSRTAPLARVLQGEEADIESGVAVPFTPITDCSRISSVEGLGSADSWLTILSMRTSGEGLGEVQTMTHAGRGGNVFVSTGNIYVAATNWDYFSPASGVPGRLPRDGVWTAVLKFGMEEGRVAFETLMEVPGSVLNQFSMDEYEGNFRVATTYGEMWAQPPNSVSNVFVFDAEGRQLGSVTGLAPGERIFSVRFQGEKGYVVTFRQTDPLFVLDLSDGANPTVLGELKIPGWSDYLHPVNATHLIGVGKDADLDGRAKGVKLALFDVSDPTDPQERYSLALGDRGTETEATWDHKAFLFHAPTGLVVLPIQLREVTEEMKEGRSADELQWMYGQLTLDGAIVLQLGEGGFEEKGRVSHMDEAPTEDNWWGHNMRKIWRSGYMAGGEEEVLFTYSSRELRVYDINDSLSLRAAAPLSVPQCVVDN